MKNILGVVIVIIIAFFTNLYMLGVVQNARKEVEKAQIALDQKDLEISRLRASQLVLEVVELRLTENKTILREKEVEVFKYVEEAPDGDDDALLNGMWEAYCSGDSGSCPSR